MSKIERIRTGVKAFIVHQGKILVIKEKLSRDGKERILNDLPGGGIDLGESLIEALKREVREEVDLEIENPRPVGSWDFVVEKPEEAIHIVCLAYQCQVVGEPVINTSNNPAPEDIFEAVWMTKEEILADRKLFESEDIYASLENVKI